MLVSPDGIRLLVSFPPDGNKKIAAAAGSVYLSPGYNGAPARDGSDHLKNVCEHCAYCQ